MCVWDDGLVFFFLIELGASRHPFSVNPSPCCPALLLFHDPSHCLSSHQPRQTAFWQVLQKATSHYSFFSLSGLFPASKALLEVFVKMSSSPRGLQWHSLMPASSSLFVTFMTFIIICSFLIVYIWVTCAHVRVCEVVPALSTGM